MVVAVEELLERDLAPTSRIGFLAAEDMMYDPGGLEKVFVRSPEAGLSCNGIGIGVEWGPIARTDALGSALATGKTPESSSESIAGNNDAVVNRELSGEGCWRLEVAGV